MNAPFRIINTPERVKLSVDDFLLLNDHGAFAEYTKTELIDGEIYAMNAQHARHARVKTRLSGALAAKLHEIGSGLEVLVEVTVRANGDSAPEPDIALTSYRGDRELPVDTVALVVEVSDTTVARDVGRKAVLYAEVGILGYWAVDLENARLFIHHQPTAAGYRERRELRLGERLAAETIEGLELGTGRLTEI